LKYGFVRLTNFDLKIKKIGYLCLSGTMAEQLTPNPEIISSKLATGTGKERSMIICLKQFCPYQQLDFIRSLLCTLLGHKSPLAYCH